MLVRGMCDRRRSPIGDVRCELEELDAEDVEVERDNGGEESREDGEQARNETR
jgi:hypothetical protein